MRIDRFSIRLRLGPVGTFFVRFPPPPRRRRPYGVARSRFRSIIAGRSSRSERSMKIRLLTLVGLAISFAVPTIAQQTNTPDPQLRERLITRIKAHTDALDKNDAAAVAANFTEDAVNLEQDGPTFGREPIAKLWADRFQKVHFSNNLVTVDQESPHIISTDGKQIWATAPWMT